jgi:antitoxin component YwqK of YwqJK toxin-antitoxin module
MGHPELVCPTGTRPTGYPPPAGREVWCERPTPSGATVREGPSIAWHDNEARKAEGAFVDGKPNGPWVTYYATGGPQTQGSYTMGVKDGAWTTYHANGSKASSGTFVDGAEHGWWQYWDEASTWRTEGNYVFGQKDGMWLEYGGGEHPVREREFREGRMVTVREL